MKSTYPVLFLLLLFFLFLAHQAHAQQDTTISEDESTPLPVFNLTPEEISEYGESQDISGLLQSSRDIFISTAGYTFGPARYRMRGYDSENTAVLINGVLVNDVESGRAYWAAWGGLNDALRNQEINPGISPSSMTYGGIGGITNIETRASSYPRGVKFSYAMSNRTYTNRMMFLAATGEMENGWSVVASGSRRWAQEGYVEGTFYDAWSYFLSVEKKISGAHSLGLIGYASPNKRGMSGLAVQEAYDLTGTNFYNPYWGFQNGDKRNSRIANYHQPMFMLSHYWNMSERAKLTTSVYNNFGRGGSTALNWVETGDPRPDYYRNLPGYQYDEGNYDAYRYLRSQWMNNEDFRQINWDNMYFANSKFLYTVDNVNGEEGNDVTGLRSKYIVEQRRHDKNQFGLVSTYTLNRNEHADLSAGLNLTLYKGYHFNVVDDLLGGDFWLDIDKYADQEPFVITSEAQSDLRNPNRIVKEGDRYAHDYTSNVHTYSGYVQEEYTYSKVDFYWGFSLSQTTFWRTGHMQNGRFPEHSYGDSEKQKFTNYGIKGGVTYKVNGKNFISGNGAYLTRAPFFRDSYISPRTRDFVVDPLRSEKILSGDLSFIHRSDYLRSRISIYYASFRDETWARSFYHEDLNTFVNYLMTGVDKVNTGIELGAEANITTSLSLLGVFGTGRYLYDSRPDVTIARDNDEMIIVDDENAYLKNYYQGGMPQTVASLGLKYNSSRYWFAQVKVNYFDDIYLSLNPARRTEGAVAGLSADDIRTRQVLNQEKLPEAFTLDAFGGKSWKIKDNYYLGFTLSINNILDKTDFRTGGYEQYRFDPDNISKFPPKYFYYYGRTYYVNVYFRFR
ncbi:MAG: TonB-dependent receptor [Bacteroidales bacterium]